MCPYTPSDFIRFLVNSLVPLNGTWWGCNEFNSAHNKDGLMIALTFCSSEMVVVNIHKFVYLP
jgi:hypothetical protein